MNIPTIPDNSLTEEIKEIVSLCQQLEPKCGANAFSFAPPATEEELSDWENRNGISIPEDYKDWLRFSNGSVIEFDLARFNALQYFSVNSNLVPDDLVIIGALIGDGEILCFSKKTGKIIRHLDGEATTVSGFKQILINIIKLMKGESCLSKDSFNVLLSMAKANRVGR